MINTSNTIVTANSLRTPQNTIHPESGLTESITINHNWLTKHPSAPRFPVPRLIPGKTILVRGVAARHGAWGE